MPRSTVIWTTTAGLAAGMGADTVFGDPRRGHPVAGFGQAAGVLERLAWADSRARGAAHAMVAAGLPTLAAAVVDRVLRRRSPVVHAAAVAATTWAVVGGKSLVREARHIGEALSAHDLDTARRRLPHLCGRDPSSLDEAGLARATVESVAENTSDAVVGPLFWGGVAGLPGLVAYRAVNTLDAMVGHKSERYRNFGWASARMDDAANFAPARLAGVLAAVSAPLVGGRPGDALKAWRRDARNHPSPNAGVVEASFAGALGRELGGTTVYPYGVEERPRLGSGPPVTTADIARAARLSRAVSLGALAAVALGRAARARSRR